MHNHWYKRRVHISWHIFWFCLGVYVGTIISLYIASNLASSKILVLISFVLFFASIKKLWVGLFILPLLAGVMLGIWRGAVEHQAIFKLRPLLNSRVYASGELTDDIINKAHDSHTFWLNKTKINNQNLPGAMWVSISEPKNLARGDRVIISGVLSKGFGSVPYTISHARIVLAKPSLNSNVQDRIRNKFSSAIKKSLSGDNASLGLGFLIGKKADISESLINQLRVVGLTHIIVASGYNLTILVNLARRLFSRVSKYLTFLFASLMVIGFLYITGFSPSMIRAALVSELSLGAWYFGRKIKPHLLLAIVASLMLLVRPSYAWGDIGWYLSFAAFTGVIILAPLLQEYFWGIYKPPGFLRELFISTFSAQILTLPIILYVFGQYSIYSLIANMMVLPLIPLTMFFTFFAGIITIINVHLASVAGIPANIMLNFISSVVNKLGNLPNAQSDLKLKPIHLAATYFLLLVVILALQFKSRQNARLSKSNITD